MAWFTGTSLGGLTREHDVVVGSRAPLAQRLRDPGMRGFGFVIAAGVYAGLLFVDGSIASRLVVGIALLLVLVAVAAFALPTWKESDERLRRVGAFMALEGLAIAAVATVVRLTVA